MYCPSNSEPHKMTFWTLWLGLSRGSKHSWLDRTSRAILLSSGVDAGSYPDDRSEYRLERSLDNHLIKHRATLELAALSTEGLSCAYTRKMLGDPCKNFSRNKFKPRSLSNIPSNKSVTNLCSPIGLEAAVKG